MDHSEVSRIGGRSRSERKIAAARKNLERARAVNSPAKQEAARKNLKIARKKRWEKKIKNIS